MQVQADWGAIFDMDGTLVPNHAYHLKAWEAFSQRHNLRWNREGYTASFGGTNTDILHRLFQAELDEATIAAYAAEKEALYRELYAPDLTATPGVLALVEALHATGIPLAVATNGIGANVDFVLDKLGIASRFRVQLNIADVQHGKPAPDIYLLAAQRLGLPPMRCVVFEDSVTGVQAARAADMPVVGIATTIPAAELAAAGADPVLPDFVGLTPALVQRVLPA